MKGKDYCNTNSNCVRQEGKRYISRDRDTDRQIDQDRQRYRNTPRQIERQTDRQTPRDQETGKTKIIPTFATPPKGEAPCLPYPPL